MVVMGGRDWFQASASAMGILGVTSSDMGHDTGLLGSMAGHIWLHVG